MSNEQEVHWRTVCVHEVQAELLAFRQEVLDEYGSFDHIAECGKCAGYEEGLHQAIEILTAETIRTAITEAMTKQIAEEIAVDVDEFLADHVRGIDHGDDTRPE